MRGNKANWGERRGIPISALPGQVRAGSPGVQRWAPGRAASSDHPPPPAVSVCLSLYLSLCLSLCVTPLDVTRSPRRAAPWGGRDRPEDLEHPRPWITRRRRRDQARTAWKRQHP